MRALVTGVAGFIGSNLAERLVAQGIDVRGVDRLSDHYDPALKRANLAPLLDGPHFEYREADVNDLDPPELLGGVEVVYHLAGQPGVGASWGSNFGVYVEDNVLSTQRLLQAAQELELERFILASSSSVYGDATGFPTREDQTPAPISPYGVTKVAAEHLCRLHFRGYGVPTVTLRYFTIFGPRQRPDMAFSRFIRAALEGRRIEVYGDGRQRRDFTFVDDAVEATIAAGSTGKPGSVYNIAGGNVASVLDVIEGLERLTGSEIAIEHQPAVAGDLRRTGADTTAAREQLGFRPKVGLEEGLRRQIAIEAARRGADPRGRSSVKPAQRA
jgi:UDP-glucuronate 4-epimerase